MLKHHVEKIRDLDLHFVTAGEGFPLVLLHGWPQSWHCWNKIIPSLTEKYSIIAPDLRGLGDTSRSVDGYEKANIAEDIRTLVHDHLKTDAYYLIAHDWGGPVAFVLAAEELVELAHNERRNAVDIFEFTNHINNVFSKEEKKAILKEFYAGQI